MLKVDLEVKVKMGPFWERTRSELLELNGFFKEPVLIIHDVTHFHLDMNLPVIDPMFLIKSPDGLDIGQIWKDESWKNLRRPFRVPNQKMVDITEKVKPEKSAEVIVQRRTPRSSEGWSTSPMRNEWKNWDFSIWKNEGLGVI
uniref:Uncharacterized protein n=1 Tax=Malurus cyaneus samueli TaxID=2593467 RepID=A0A8C5TS62_9PASS